MCKEYHLALLENDLILIEFIMYLIGLFMRPPIESGGRYVKWTGPDCLLIVKNSSGFVSAILGHK
jgi:hypothetical protein